LRCSQIVKNLNPLEDVQMRKKPERSMSFAELNRWLRRISGIGKSPDDGGSKKKRWWQGRHQGERECARRRKQIERGIIPASEVWPS
jgi:hypothetical protein